MRRPSFPDAIRLLLAVALVALLGLRGAKAQTIERVDSVGIMVSDMDRSLDFYTGVPPFEVILETEVEGDAYERLFGVFGMRARTVRLRLGEEEIEGTAAAASSKDVEAARRGSWGGSPALS